MNAYEQSPGIHTLDAFRLITLRVIESFVYNSWEEPISLAKLTELINKSPYIQLVRTHLNENYQEVDSDSLVTLKDVIRSITTTFKSTDIHILKENKDTFTLTLSQAEFQTIINNCTKRYTDDIIKQIRQDEDDYKTKLAEISLIEKGSIDNIIVQEYNTAHTKQPTPKPLLPSKIKPTVKSSSPSDQNILQSSAFRSVTPPAVRPVSASRTASSELQINPNVQEQIEQHIHQQTDQENNSLLVPTKQADKKERHGEWPNDQKNEEDEDKVLLDIPDASTNSHEANETELVEDTSIIRVNVNTGSNDDKVRSDIRSKSEEEKEEEEKEEEEEEEKEEEEKAEEEKEEVSENGLQVDGVVESNDKQDQQPGSTKVKESEEKPVLIETEEMNQKRPLEVESKTEPIKKKAKIEEPPRQPNKKLQVISNPLLANVSSYKYASAFLQPVNESLAPDYYSFIKQPRDLKTIKQMVKDGRIQNKDELEREILLMYANAIMYNKTGTDIYDWAKEMQVETDKMMEIFRDTDTN